MNQQDKILNLLSDHTYHCTSEMAALFMVDYRRRLVDLQRKGYIFENRHCTQHNHPMKEWRLINSPSITVTRNDWKAMQAPAFDPDPITQYRTCCYSFKIFQTHDPKCSSLKIKQGQLL